MQPTQLGPYRITRKLGEGAMGAVFEGIDADGTHVAIKLLPHVLAKQQSFLDRFDIEIETLRKLDHPNIIRLIGFGEQDGQLYYAMELVKGVNLEDKLSAGYQFKWREVVKIGVHLCKALQHAHDRGIIHRDIKPENIMLTNDRRIKLADFGIAKLWGVTGVTNPGGLMGTANYMSPEQAEGLPVSTRSDMYSLGMTLYALLAGRPAFLSDSLPQLLKMQRHATPESVRVFSPDTPGELDRLLKRALSKEPTQRIGSPDAMGRRLFDLLRGEDSTRSNDSSVSEIRTDTPTAHPNRVPSQSTPIASQASEQASDQDLPKTMAREDAESSVKETAGQRDPASSPREASPPSESDRPAGGQVSEVDMGDMQTMVGTRASADTPDTHATEAGQTDELAGTIAGSGASSSVARTFEDFPASGIPDTNPSDDNLDATRVGGPVDQSPGLSPAPGSTDATLPPKASMPSDDADAESLTGSNDDMIATQASGQAPEYASFDAASMELDFPDEPTVTVASASREGTANEIPLADEPTALGKKKDTPPEAGSQNAAGTFVVPGAYTTKDEADAIDAELKANAPKDTPRQGIYLSPQLIGYGLAFVMVLVLIFFAFKPLSADDLYVQLTAVRDNGSVESLLNAEDHVRQFGELYPDDERRPEIEAIQERIDLARYERILDRGSVVRSLTPEEAAAEQLFLDALRTSRLDPNAGADQFQALLDLYEGHDASGKSRRIEKCLRLARGLLDETVAKQRKSQGHQVAGLIKRFKEAQTLAESDPTRAQTILKAIIKLYDGKPWAQQRVDAAKELLAGLPQENPEKESTTDVDANAGDPNKPSD